MIKPRRWGCSAFDHERITHLLIEAEDGIIFACKKCYVIPFEIMEPVVENKVCPKCWEFHEAQKDTLELS